MSLPCAASWRSGTIWSRTQKPRPCVATARSSSCTTMSRTDVTGSSSAMAANDRRHRMRRNPQFRRSIERTPLGDLLSPSLRTRLLEFRQRCSAKSFRHRECDRDRLVVIGEAMAVDRRICRSHIKVSGLDLRNLAPARSSPVGVTLFQVAPSSWVTWINPSSVPTHTVFRRAAKAQWYTPRRIDRSSAHQCLSPSLDLASSAPRDSAGLDRC